MVGMCFESKFVFTQNTHFLEEQNRINCTFMKALLKLGTTVKQILSNLVTSRDFVIDLQAAGTA